MNSNRDNFVSQQVILLKKAKAEESHTKLMFVNLCKLLPLLLEWHEETLGMNSTG